MMPPCVQSCLLGVMMAAAVSWFLADTMRGAEGLESRPANVLFILSDDQRADTIHALGNPIIRTPNLDRLAAQGTAFTRAYIMGGMQGAVCVPSRAMVMSGRPLFRVPESLANTVTWPQVFAGAGYQTFATGKWHNGANSCLASFPEARGVFLGGMSDQFKVVVQDALPGGKQFGPARTNATYSGEYFASEAMDFLKRRDPKRPFAMYVAFTVPHDPRTAPPEFHHLYGADSMRLPPNFLPLHPFNNGDMALRDELLEAWPRTDGAVRRHLSDYYASVSALDTQIGRILDALKASGDYDRTIIVFAGDNGLAIGSHGLMGKQNLYEHSVNVPLIIAGPGVPRGRKSEAMCYLLDLFPTLCDLAGLRIPAGVEGRSLTPVLQGQAARSRHFIFTAYRQFQRAYRDDRWKLIRYPHINRTQLFDLQADPFETRDLADDAGQADRLRQLTASLEAAQREFGDRLPLTTKQPVKAGFVPPQPNPRNRPQGTPSS